MNPNLPLEIALHKAIVRASDAAYAWITLANDPRFASIGNERCDRFMEARKRLSRFLSSTIKRF